LVQDGGLVERARHLAREIGESGEKT